MDWAKTTCTIFLCVSANLLLGQTADDLKYMRLANEKAISKASVSRKIRLDQDNSSFLGISFMIYKNFISSQDGSHCVFTPSCSSYALQSIQKRGPLLGMLAAIDRLTRCHGLSRNQYPIDLKQKLYYDPVE